MKKTFLILGMLGGLLPLQAQDVPAATSSSLPVVAVDSVAPKAKYDLSSLFVSARFHRALAHLGESGRLRGLPGEPHESGGEEPFWEAFGTETVDGGLPAVAVDPSKHLINEAAACQ